MGRIITNQAKRETKLYRLSVWVSCLSFIAFMVVAVWSKNDGINLFLGFVGFTITASTFAVSTWLTMELAPRTYSDFDN